MLSFQKSEDIICAVKDKNDKIIKYVYLHDNEKDGDDNFEELSLSNGFTFQQIPNKNKERDCIYVAGMAGSGKSYYMMQFVKEYIKVYPKRNIYLFSYKNEDKSLDSIKKIERIDINDKDFLNEELTYEDFKSSLVIMDDVDCVPNKKLKTKILNLVNQLLQIGRSYEITVCWACHEVLNSHETKIILSECHSLTIFPRTMGNRKLKYLLEEYFGFDKQQIQKINSLKSRWTTIYKTYPKVIMSQHDIYVL